MLTENPIFDSLTPTSDNRRHARFELPAIYEIAACRGNNIPDSEFFFGINCCDISASGFSFVTERLPTLHFVVLRMRLHKRKILLRAKIMNHRQCKNGSYIVGCMFVEKFSS